MLMADIGKIILINVKLNNSMWDDEWLFLPITLFISAFVYIFSYFNNFLAF